MAANTSPIFTLTPHSAISASITAANTAMDGTGTVTTLFTAGAQGSYVKDIWIRAQGTNVATVFRVFLNNGGANSSAANNALIAELSIASTTASNTTALANNYITIERAIGASYVLIATIGTAVAAGLIATTFGGDY